MTPNLGKLVAERRAARTPAWQEFRDSYLAEIEQYKGTPYYDLLLNNPYLPTGNEYTPSWFEKTFSQNTFNDYSKEDNYYTSLIQSAREEQARILGQKMQNEYNSPLAQAGREKAAGLNSDLVGVSGEPAAGSTGPDEMSPAAPQSQTFEERLGPFINQLSSVGTTLFQNVLSFGTFLQQFKGASLENQLKDLTLGTTAYNEALGIVAGFLPADFADGASDVEKMSAADLDSMFGGTLDAAIKEAKGAGMFSNPRVAKLMKRLTGQVQYGKDGKPTLAYQRYRAKFMADLLGERSKSANILGSVGFDDDLMTWAKNIGEKFNDIQYKTFDAIQKAQQKKAKYEQDYYGTQVEGTTLGSETGQSDWYAAHEASLQKELDNIVNEGFKEIYDICKKGDKWYHTVGMFLIPALRFALQRLSRASFSGHASSSAGSSWNEITGDSGSRSSSGFFNFGF